jgi:uncharacterized protein (TIGR00255 family)
MTGYGSAEASLDGVSYIVEIKTVNNRYYKTKLQIPNAVAFLEDDIESLLRRHISRGMINFVVYIKNAPAGLLFDIDEGMLSQLLVRVNEIGRKTKTKYTIDVGNLLNLPDVVLPASPDAETAGKIKAIILELTGKAIESLRNMRKAEGIALEEDLARHCDKLKESLLLISGRSDTVLKDYAGRLQKRANELLARSELKIDEQTVAREVAVFAEKSDISEEIDRLDSHIQQFTETCKGGSKHAGQNVAEQAGSTSSPQAGKRLDFICQEMLREANTIGSKAADSQIIHTVVDIKCLIDRIKEQVQNIE